MSNAINNALGRLHDSAFNASLMMFQQSAEAAAQFMQEVDAYCERIKANFAQTYDAVEEEVVKAIDRAAEYIDDRGWQLASGLIGVVAGGFQVVGGMTLIATSKGIGLPVGAAMAAHGANNIYEGVSGVYGFFSNEDAATGKLKEWVYRGSVRAVGLDPAWGDVIYGGADIALSLGAVGMKIHSAPRMFSGERVFGQRAWKLERFIETDFQRGFQQMGRGALVFEGVADGVTGYGAYDSVPNR